ncbi:50S ribosomal protein L10 [Planctomycetales bacterium]|nr:50S ribosomal protein L10 [Planctomycetales bacterium]
MPNRVNKLLVKEYRARFAGVQNLVSIGYEGLEVNAQRKMRNAIADSGVNFCFVKNKLANIAFKEMGLPEIKSICAGQTALVFGEDPVAIARLLTGFAQENDKLKIHGGLVEGTVIDANGVAALAKSPTKDELKAQIVGQALSPARNVAGALVSPASNIAGCVKALVEKLEQAA